MKINRNKTLKCIRIIVYIAFIIIILLLKYTNVIRWTCFIQENFGIQCPMCGVTRTLVAIANFNFPLAIERNAYVALVLFPIFLILFVDDIVSMILKKKSFVDIILGE